MYPLFYSSVTCLAAFALIRPKATSYRERYCFDTIYNDPCPRFRSRFEIQIPHLMAPAFPYDMVMVLPAFKSKDYPLVLGWLPSYLLGSVIWNKQPCLGTRRGAGSRFGHNWSLTPLFGRQSRRIFIVTHSVSSHGIGAIFCIASFLPPLSSL